jgi:hypothetical protein
VQKDDFPLYNINKKIKLVTKNKEPEQKHAKKDISMKIIIIIRNKRNVNKENVIVFESLYFFY